MRRTRHRSVGCDDEREEGVLDGGYQVASIKPSTRSRLVDGDWRSMELDGVLDEQRVLETGSTRWGVLGEEPEMNSEMKNDERRVLERWRVRGRAY